MKEAEKSHSDKVGATDLRIFCRNDYTNETSEFITTGIAQDNW